MKAPKRRLRHSLSSVLEQLVEPPPPPDRPMPRFLAGYDPKAPVPTFDEKGRRQ